MNIVKKIVRYSKTIALLYKALDSYVLQPDIRDLDSIYTRFSAGTLGLRESSTLDLGCGAQPKNPFWLRRCMDSIFGRIYQRGCIMLTSRRPPFHLRTISLITLRPMIFLSMFLGLFTPHLENFHLLI